MDLNEDFFIIFPYLIYLFVNALGVNLEIIRCHFYLDFKNIVK